jgi:hypothetical protein
MENEKALDFSTEGYLLQITEREIIPLSSAFFLPIARRSRSAPPSE